MTKGKLHPIKRKAEPLVVDMDPERAARLAAWQSGDAVAEPKVLEPAE